MTSQEKYIRMRLRKAWWMSLPFYICRIFPINRRKITFMCIEGTTGYTCNPKYIAEEFIRQNKQAKESEKYQLTWLVDDMTKEFPKEIKVYKNTLWNRAFHLTTSKFWIDNSRKQLECRKRKGQIYIQTWHAKLGFKPTCLDRGASFSKIAYLVSKHDSDMVDYWLSNSDWYDNTLKNGSLYEGKTIRCGSPRCDILVKAKEDKAYKNDIKKKLCEIYGVAVSGDIAPDILPSDISSSNISPSANVDEIHFLMYAPTFRGGSQEKNRAIEIGNHFPDYERLKKNLENKFGGKWYILLRLHPQLVARGMGVDGNKDKSYLLDGSLKDDMYELLAGCDAFMTDYSSAAFDAMVMNIPIFLYCDDYEEYVGERGDLLWDLRELPFVLAENDEDLEKKISSFSNEDYIADLNKLLDETNMVEDGNGARVVVEKLEEMIV